MKSKKYNLYLLFAILGYVLLTTNACRTIKPEKPTEGYSATPMERNISNINIPVEISIAELEKHINKQVTGLIYEDDGTKNENFLFKVWKREAITIKGDSNIFHIKVPLKVWVKADMNFNKMGMNLSESKDTEFEINLNFASKISLNSDYRVISTTIGNGYEWVKKPVLKLGLFEVSLGSFVGPRIEDAQKEISKRLDLQVKDKINIRKQVQQAWAVIQQPLLISDEYQVWLNLIPTEILMSPLYGNNTNIKSTIGIRAITETTIGNKPEHKEASSLPALKISNSIQDDFAIIFAGKISHDQAQQVISERFLNKEFTFKNGKRKITITALDLYGSGENLIIEADVTGSLDGKIYLSGKPYYDPSTQSLIIQNLDYDLDTKNRLARTASWLLKGRMVKNMEESLKIPLENQMMKARNAIEEKLKNNMLAKGIYLNGNLEDLAPADVYMTEDSIVALVKANGKAEITLNGL